MAKGNFIEAEGLVKKLNEAFTDHVKVVQMSVQTVKSLNDEYKKLPSDYAKGLKDVAAAQEKSVQATKNLKDNTEKLVVAKKKEVQTILDQSKSYQGLSKQKETSIKQAEREASAIERASNVYNKVQAKVNALSATYNNLAIKKELGLKLNDRENAQLASLETRLNKYQGALKAVDANIQKNQRNVGNYAGSFNGLGNSINQITRELPAFTFSAQTGFLALSNNIPILTDEIGRLVEKNKELAKQGQPVKSVFSQILSGVFSLQTAMGVGILLFTLYGKEIGAFVSELFNGANSMKFLAETTKILNEATTEALKNITKEKVELKTLLSIAQDETKSKQQRFLAVDKLQKQYPEYFGNLSREKILAGETADAEEKLTKAILQKAKAQALVGKITENETAIIDLLDKEAIQVVDLNNAIKEEIRVKKILKNEIGAEAVSLRLQAEDRRKLADERRDQTIREITDRRKRSQFLLRSVTLETVLTDDNTDAVKSNTDATIKNNDEKEKVLKLGTVDWLTEQISQLKELNDSLSDNSDEYEVGAKSIEFYESWLDRLTNKLKKTKKAIEDVGVSISDSDLTGEGVDNWDKDQMDEFRKNTFGAFDEGGEELTEDWKEKFQKWSSVALDAINVVQEAQQRAYEQELGRLENSRNVAILFAGESSTARAEIERQYDEKRRLLLNRQAKERKTMAIAEAVINTAVAVVSALKDGIPMAIAVGIIGAAQIALIASQQVPQFYKGTDNAPEGMAWTQERGAELITDKHGKVKSLGSNKGAQLTHLNKGDKVFNAKETKSIMFNNELNGILMNNGISNASTVVNNNLDLSPLNSRLDNLTNVIKNKPEWSLIRDVQGERLYQKEQGVKKLLVSNRLRIKS